MAFEIALGILLALFILPFIPILAVGTAVVGGFWAIFHYDLWLVLDAGLAVFFLVSIPVGLAGRRNRVAHEAEVERAMGQFHPRHVDAQRPGLVSRLLGASDHPR